MLVAVLDLYARRRGGAFLFARPEGMRLFIAKEVPYRWPVQPWEACETQRPLGFKAGTFWIGGMKAGKGPFLIRYRYVVLPYWCCAAAVAIAAGGIAAHVRERKPADLPLA